MLRSLLLSEKFLLRRRIREPRISYGGLQSPFRRGNLLRANWVVETTTMLPLRALALLACSTSTLGAAVQKSGLVLPPTAAASQQAVVDMFLESYDTYK